MHNSHGVALLAALFVLMVMSILAIGMLANVDEDLKITKNSENSERALKIAESGVQIARAVFFEMNEDLSDTEAVRELRSVNGFMNGGYFLAQVKAGFVGDEKWTQWRYDSGLTGNNKESEISAPIQRAWLTEANGVNGSFDGNYFTLKNLFGLVAGGVYFPIEMPGSATVDTNVRAHDEYSGNRSLGHWTWDKKITNVTLSPDIKYAAKMSPMGSFSNYSTIPGEAEDELTGQTLYLTYSGDDTDIKNTDADTTSTVRLRAVNALCNVHGSESTPSELRSLWEFDTGVHGVGTPPAVFDPTPDLKGDEIVYFAVAGVGTDCDLNSPLVGYPENVNDGGEQIYLFAIVDISVPSSCSGDYSKDYVVKWAHPFPDPDVAEWTDYPSEHATGMLGQTPPYVARPSDMMPFMPEDDLLADYRDGPGSHLTTGHPGRDDQWNQVRGNIYDEYPRAVGPPVLNILYHSDDSNPATTLTTNRAEATTASLKDPLINVYLMFAQVSRSTYNVNWSGTSQPSFDNTHASIASVDGWGNAGYRKPNATQVRVIALRDRLVNNGNLGSWNWKKARSRYPKFKWSYRVPSWDPNRTDNIPPNGYGEYTWDTMFIQQLAPMLVSTEEDQAGNSWTALATTTAPAGSRNLYPVVYPSYKSTGFPFQSGYVNNTAAGRAGPDVDEGATEDFSGQSWTDARIMMAAVRDTWDDYMAGNRTNPNYDTLAGTTVGTTTQLYWSNQQLSSPVEDYWTYTSTTAPVEADYKYSGDSGGETMIVYHQPGTQYLDSPYPAGVKFGYPRPYSWWENLWDQKIKTANQDKPWSLFRQGWIDVLTLGSTPSDGSVDADIEGETAAVCQDCLDGDGLIVLAFNHDLWNGSVAREDLRLHGINAKTGKHVWDFHAAASLAGDNANNSPAIANNKVFMAYMMYDAETNRDNRKAKVEILDASDGRQRQRSGNVIDDDADAVIMAPAVANGMVYIGTYDYAGDADDDGPGVQPVANSSSWTRSDTSDDLIRMFALTPVLRIVSTGIYPMQYQNYTGTDNYKLLEHDDILKDDETEFGVKGVRTAKRKIQVWINGQSSRWEEVKGVVKN